ncbi:hypothetical protein [Shewanella violacea]|nr:hypothetical protein [Shewanella violacea]
MNNKIKCLLLIFSGLYATVVQADNYLLTMSQDDKACQRLYQLFNGDLMTNGKLALEEHEEFNWLKWDQPYFIIRQKSELEPNFEDELLSENEYEQEYASYTKYFYKGAFFDVDNNGVDEFISFERRGPHTYQNRAYDNIYIYKKDSYKRLRGAKSDQQFSPAIGYVGRFTNSYVLKEYPIKRKTVYTTGAISHSWPNLSDPYIRPLLLDKTYYIASFGNVDTRITGQEFIFNQSIDEKNAIAIVKFIPSYDAEKIENQPRLLSTGQPSNETQDICYFVKTQAIQQGVGDD